MTEENYIRAASGRDQAGRDDWATDEASTTRSIPMVDKQLDSRDLFASGRLVTITHGEHRYQLRLTAQNKLILTK